MSSLPKQAGPTTASRRSPARRRRCTSDRQTSALASPSCRQPFNTVHADTVLITWLGMAIVVGGVRRARALHPGHAAHEALHILELHRGGAERSVTTILGRNGVPFVPFIISLFMFIFVMNEIGLFPFIGKSPTADLNTTAALAIFAICLVRAWASLERARLLRASRRSAARSRHPDAADHDHRRIGPARHARDAAVRQHLRGRDLLVVIAAVIAATSRQHLSLATSVCRFSSTHSICSWGHPSARIHATDDRIPHRTDF